MFTLQIVASGKKQKMTYHKSIEKFIQSDQLRYCNGIVKILHDKIIVSTSRGFQIIDLKSREINRLDMKYLSMADGLYVRGNSLVAILNVFYPVSIVQFDLSVDFLRVVNERLLLTNHQSFDIPTTGVIVRGWFYYIANSQLDHVVGDTLVHKQELKETEIWKLKLD